MIRKPEKESFFLHPRTIPVPKIDKREFVQCVMCKRLVDRSEISFLKLRISPKQLARVPVCHLCQVDPNKVRYYIAQRRTNP